MSSTTLFLLQEKKEKERKETKKFEERKSKNVHSFINIDFDFSFIKP
jgi:hypothetical protein